MSGLRPSLRPRDIPSHRRTAASRPVVREGRALQSFPGLGHRPPRTICFWSVAARGRGAESSLLVPLHPRCPERPWRLVRLKRPFAPFLSLWRPFRRHLYTMDVNRKGSGRGPRGRSGLGNTRGGRRRETENGLWISGLPLLPPRVRGASSFLAIFCCALWGSNLSYTRGWKAGMTSSCPLIRSHGGHVF